MIKRILTVVSGVHESVLVDFINQNFACSQNLSKLSLSKISSQNQTNLCFFIFFEFLSYY